MPTERVVVRLVPVRQPLRDDVLPAGPRLPVRPLVVPRVVGEQRPDLGRVVRVPGPPVALDPGGDPVGVLVVGHRASLERPGEPPGYRSDIQVPLSIRSPRSAAGPLYR